MKDRDNKHIKIENKGKIETSLMQKTEKFISFLYYDLDKGAFSKLSPKLFRVLKPENLAENEEFGFEFTILFTIFKGRVEIRKQKNLDYYNIKFFKRRFTPGAGQFEYDLYIVKNDVKLEDINKQFDFIPIGEHQKIKTGNIYLLKNGLVGIIKKYYSNSKIGIIYDEDSEDVEEYIRIEDIEKLLRAN